VVIGGRAADQDVAAAAGLQGRPVGAGPIKMSWPRPQMSRSVPPQTDENIIGVTVLALLPEPERSRLSLPLTAKNITGHDVGQRTIDGMRAVLICRAPLAIDDDATDGKGS